MDMTPPQAPPAVVSSAQQSTIDTVGRLVAIHDWLIEQRDTLPELPPATGDVGKDDYLAALAAYWEAPVAGAPGMAPMPRRSALATHLAAVMRDEATLRHDDGTLSEADATLAAGFARSPGGSTSEARALELMVGGTPYAGALVLENPEGRALLFMPGRGWEAFANLDALHTENDRRMRDALAGTSELAGLVHEAVALDTPDALITSRDIGAHPFEVLTERLIAVQREKAAGAWHIFADQDIDDQALVDRLRVITQPDAILDIVGLLAHRDIRLQDALDAERLAPLPSDVRSEWNDALTTWRGTLKAVAQLRVESDLTERVPLQQFALDSLAKRLSALGIAENPAELRVQVTPDPLNPLKQWFHGAEPSETGLLELALQNVGAIPEETYRLVRADGTAIAIDSEAIHLLVRGTDAGSAYLAYLNETFDAGSVTGKAHRDLATRLQRARMRFDLADARVSSFIPEEPRGLMPDHAERGYHWVRAALDGLTPDRRHPVEGHEIVVRQLTYKQTPVADVLLFGVRGEGGVFRVVLYTPDAPDGKTFREYDDRAHAARDFLLNPTFETYLLDRLPTSFTHRLPNGTRHFKRDDASRQANWVLGSGNPPDQIQLDEAIAERDIEGDFLDAVYDTSLQKVTTDVLAASRATDVADWQGRVAAILAGPSNPLGDIGAAISTDVILAVPRAFQASWRAYDSIKAGDYGQGFVDMTKAYTSALNLAGLASSQTMRGVGSAVRVGRDSRALTATGKKVTAPAAVFEPRFRASGVSTNQAMTAPDGVLRIGGKTYIEQGAHLYHVRFDAATNGWRLTRPGALDALVSGPAITRTTMGTWRVRNDIGLLGGMDPLRAAMRANRSARLREAAQLDPRGTRMTTGQLFEAHRELFRRHGIVRATRIIDDAIAQSRAPSGVEILTPADRAFWQEALDVGRGARVATPLSGQQRIAATRVAVAAGHVPRPGPSNPRPVSTAPSAFPVPPGTDLVPLRAAVELVPEAWPAFVWHYVSAEQVPPAASPFVMLTQSVQRATGLQGVPVTTRPPYATSQVLQGTSSGAGVLPGPAMGQRAGGWVRIELGNLRSLRRADGRSTLRVFRSQNAAGEFEYILRPMSIARDPTAQRPIVFSPGNFQTGRWRPLPR